MSAQAGPSGINPASGSGSGSFFRGRKRPSSCLSPIAPSPPDESPSPSPLQSSWSQTQRQTVKAEHTWTIDDFFERCRQAKPGSKLKPHSFGVQVQNPTSRSPASTSSSSSSWPLCTLHPWRHCANHTTEKYRLQVCTTLNGGGPSGAGSDHGAAGDEGTSDGPEGDVGLFIINRSNRNHDVKFSFSLLQSDGLGRTFLFERPLDKLPVGGSRGRHKAFAKSFIEAHQDLYVVNGAVTVVCQVEIYLEDVLLRGKKRKVEFHKEKNSLSKDLAALLKGDFHDVTLICGGRRVPCHKLLLSARSDVFSRMFSHANTSESLNKEVIIEDADPDTLVRFVHFIYTDSLDRRQVGQHVSGLLELADKYNVARLRVVCEELLCESMSNRNVVPRLIQGHLHGANQLVRKAVDFVAKHFSELKDTSEWQALVEHHPQILHRVLEAMSTRSAKQASQRDMWAAAKNNKALRQQAPYQRAPPPPHPPASPNHDYHYVELEPVGLNDIADLDVEYFSDDDILEEHF